MSPDELDKPKAEVSEYLENGLTPETIEFQKKEAKLVKKLGHLYRAGPDVVDAYLLSRSREHWLCSNSRYG